MDQHCPQFLCQSFFVGPQLSGTDLIPNLYNFVRDSVDEVIADLIVIPNMVAVPIVPRHSTGERDVLWRLPFVLQSSRGNNGTLES